MKSGVVAVVVAVVFVLGIVAGAAFFAGTNTSSVTPPVGAAPAHPADGARHGVTPEPTADGAAPAAGPGEAHPAGAGPQGGPAPLAPPTDLTPDRAPRRPSVIPSPPSSAALSEAEKLAQERAQQGDAGNGNTRALVYEFESEEARLEHEAARRANWEARLTRENDIKVKGLRESVGLSSGQESQLREILDKELSERMRLVDALASKEITGSSFDEGIRANYEGARQALKALLTPEQFATYAKLKPREQVLQDETK
ncbi:MAG: hypothetical protein R3F62_02025 [Planctomycetota bacterium]